MNKKEYIILTKDNAYNNYFFDTTQEILCKDIVKVDKRKKIIEYSNMKLRFMTCYYYNCWGKFGNRASIIYQEDFSEAIEKFANEQKELKSKKSKRDTNLSFTDLMFLYILLGEENESN